MLQAGPALGHHAGVRVPVHSSLTEASFGSLDPGLRGSPKWQGGESSPSHLLPPLKDNSCNKTGHIWNKDTVAMELDLAPQSKEKVGCFYFHDAKRRNLHSPSTGDIPFLWAFWMTVTCKSRRICEQGKRVSKCFPHKSARLRTIHYLYCWNIKEEALILDHVNIGILMY